MYLVLMSIGTYAKGDTNVGGPTQKKIQNDFIEERKIF